MLRRKLLFNIGTLVTLLLIAAVAAIWLLQGVLGDLNHTGTVDTAMMNDAAQMDALISEIEIDLREIQMGRESHLDTLIEQVEKLKTNITRFGTAYTTALPESKNIYDQMMTVLPMFEWHVGMLATVQDRQLASPHTMQAIDASLLLRKDILQINKMMHDYVASKQTASLAWFRWVVLTLAMVFLLVINISVLVLLRTAGMILRPMDQLVEASRRLANEEFEHRVAVEQDDEFGELARAYNHLAEELQANERRKLETLAQTAVMLNHELNNASSIIKLQLTLMSRQSMGNPAFVKSLHQIETSLTRMNKVVEALKQVRKIVLIDYMPDVKMLDLEKSVSGAA